MISIVRAKAEDATEILKIKINAFKEEVKLYGFGPPGYDSLENQVSSIKESLYYMILEDERIIGGLGIIYKEQSHYRISVLHVDLEHQNMGIGTKALALLEKEFPDAVKWSLETPYLSFRNHHFYEKMGFVKTGETEPDNNGFYLFLYEKYASCKLYVET